MNLSDSDCGKKVGISKNKSKSESSIVVVVVVVVVVIELYYGIVLLMCGINSKIEAVGNKRPQG